MDEGPYRMGIATVPRWTAEDRFVPSSRWRWYLVVPAIAGAALLAAGGAATALGLSVLVYTAWGVGLDRWRRRRGANDRLRGLPFPVTHDPPSAAEADRPARAIRSVRLLLREPLSPSIASEAVAAAGVHVDIDGTAVIVTGWSWGGDDLLLLAQLLSTWGGAVHRACGVVSVEVTWDRGPGPSI